MNEKDVIRMAREAGFVEYELDDGTTRAFDLRYERFAALVAAAEREACAKAVEQAKVHQYIWYPEGYHVKANDVGSIYEFQHKRCLDAIRSKGNT